jgi:hypothetical protein
MELSTGTNARGAVATQAPPSSSISASGNTTSSSSSGGGGASRSLSSLQVEVIEVRNTDASQPLYVQLELGEHRLRANVKGKAERAEAVVFTQKRLQDLYRETLVYTLINKETRTTLGSGELAVRKLMIGRKIDHYFDVYPTAPEATTSGRVRACVRACVRARSRGRGGVCMHACMHRA